MMIKNIDEQLVNGTVGKVVDFMTEVEWAASALGGASTEKRETAEDKKQQGGKPRPIEQKLPVVEWKIVGSRHPRIDLVRPEQFKVEGPNGKIEVSRQQLPLILAWAMSIHKSQGQTLEKVKIDLRKVFEKGECFTRCSVPVVF
jgi:ATP-dependent DNA helicase PIF1